MSITKQDEVTFGEIQKGSKFVLPDPLPPDCGKFMAYWVYEKALPTHAIIIGVKPNAPRSAQQCIGEHRFFQLDTEVILQG